MGGIPAGGGLKPSWDGINPPGEGIGRRPKSPGYGGGGEPAGGPDVIALCNESTRSDRPSALDD